MTKMIVTTLICWVTVALTVFTLVYFYNFQANAIGYVLLLGSVFFLILLGGVALIEHRRQHKLITHFNEEDQHIVTDDLTLTTSERFLLTQYRQLYNETEKNEEEHQDIRQEEELYYTNWIHQIKTPIAAIQLLLDDLPNDSVKRSIMNELIRIEDYTQFILTYQRTLSFNHDLHFEVIELDSIIRQALKRYRTFFSKKQLTLVFEPSHQQVVSDRKWLQFVIDQLLSNATKYTPKNGKITISWSNNQLLLSDTGIGISAADLPRIFERGYSTREKDKASGLGLYLCFEICQQLEHHLSISSTIGSGTTVALTLK